MSETPRTDEAVKDFGSYPFVKPDFARQLERELNEARRQLKEMEDILNGCKAEIMPVQSYSHKDIPACINTFKRRVKELEAEIQIRNADVFAFADMLRSNVPELRIVVIEDANPLFGNRLRELITAFKLWFSENQRRAGR